MPDGSVTDVELMDRSSRSAGTEEKIGQHMSIARDSKSATVRTTAVKKSQSAPLPDLAEEQAYVDHAYETHRQAALATQKVRATPSATPADHRAKSATLSGEARLGPNDPASVGWMEDATGRRYYIGKTTILDEEKTPLVVNWKTPIGGKFLAAMPGDSQGLRSKRSFTTAKNTIRSYSDSHFRSSAAEAVDEAPVADQTDADGSGFALDDAVLAAMEAHRDSSMHDIVATIQADQYRILSHDPDDILLIQGGPGTGKTAVALHRLSWLLYNQAGALDADDVLVVTPNSTLTAYIRNVLPALGDEGIRQIAVPELGQQFVRAPRHEYSSVGVLKADARMVAVLHRGLQNRIGLSGDQLTVRMPATREVAVLPAHAVNAAAKRFSHLPYLAGRAALAEKLRQELVDRYPLPRRSTFEQTFDVQSFNSQVDRVWPTLSPQQFLRDFFASKRQLTAASDEILSEEDTNLLYRASASSISEEGWTDSDAFLLHEVQAQLDPAKIRRYGHIIVDEAQDLAGMQLQAIKRSSRKGAMTLAGDVAQSTGANRRDSWRSVTDLFTRRPPGQLWSAEAVTRKTLRYVYRVPREAQILANSLQDEVAPDLDVPQSMRDAEYVPTVTRSEHGDVADAVLKTVEPHVADGLMIGIIAPLSLHAVVGPALSEADVSFVFAREGQLGDGVNVVTPEAAKGLEFDAVVIVDPQQIYEGDAGARLLYIALTRTTSRLDLVMVDDRMPAALRPHLDIPESPRPVHVPSADVPALAVSQPADDAFSTGASSNTDDSAEHLVVAGSGTDAHNATSTDPADALAAKDPSLRGALSLTDQFVAMTAELHLHAIQSQVHPDLVPRVVETMQEMLARRDDH